LNGKPLMKTLVLSGVLAAAVTVVAAREALRRNLALIYAALTAICMAPSVHGALAAVAPSAPLEVSLAPYRASQGSPPLIDLATRSPQLTFVLTNKGQHTLRLWKDSCSWGYRNLSFELIDASGRRITVTRAERGWEKNVPAWNDLPSGGSLSTDVTLSGAEWRGLPALKHGEQRVIRIRAVYQSETGFDAKTHHVWVGAAHSPDMDAILSG
jgi:hypothetical protein